MFDVYTVEELAQQLDLKPQSSGGSIEYCGANPFELGATEDGFILFPEGNAWDRKLDKKYTSWEVAGLAGLTADQYAPCVEYKEQGGSLNGSPNTSPNGAPSGHIPPIIGQPRQPQSSPQPSSQDPPRMTLPKKEKKTDGRELFAPFGSTFRSGGRGLTEATREAFFISGRLEDPTLGVYWEYWTYHPDGEPGRRRRKYRNPENWQQRVDRYGKPLKPRKYVWVRDRLAPVAHREPIGYNLDGLKLAVEDKGLEEVWFVNGEVSVWLLHQYGLWAVSSFGEGQKIPEIITYLKEIGVKRVRVLLDNDRKGKSASVAIYDACMDKATGKKPLECLVHWWPLDILLDIENVGFDAADWVEQQVIQNLVIKSTQPPGAVEHDVARAVRVALRKLPVVSPPLVEPEHWEQWKAEATADTQDVQETQSNEIAYDEADGDQEENGEEPLEVVIPAVLNGANHSNASNSLHNFDNAAPKRSSPNSQAARLLQLLEETPVFMTADAKYYLVARYRDLKGTIRRETLEIEEKAARWHLERVWAAGGSGDFLEEKAYDIVVRHLERRAHEQGDVRSVYKRVGGKGEQVYIDLANRAGDMVEINSDGWRVLRAGENTRDEELGMGDEDAEEDTDEAPVVFRRPDGMLPMPIPQRHPDGNELVWQQFRELLNTGYGEEGDRNWMMMVGWMVQALRAPTEPYAVLAMSATQDSGKSVTCKMLRMLVDHSKPALAGKPKDVRDLIRRANNAHVMGWDNMSVLPDWMGDILCQIATDGEFSTAMHYDNTREVLVRALCPMIVNGIDERLGRDDFQRRCMNVALPSFKHGQKKGERVLRVEFEALWPYLLGALYDAVAMGLKRLPLPEIQAITMDEGFVDLAQFVAAAEPALPWGQGEFLRAYGGRMLQSALQGASESPVCAAIDRLMEDLKLKNRREWEGTATQLYQTLTRYAAFTHLPDETAYHLASSDRQSYLLRDAIEQLHRSKTWPQGAIGLGKMVRREVARLRAQGMEVTFVKGHEPRIRIERDSFGKATLSSQPSVPIDVNNLPDNLDQVFDESE